MHVFQVTTLPIDYLQWLLTTSAIASLIVCVILAVKFIIGNRLQPSWHYLLWFIVVLRLILPWTPESSFSLFNLINLITNSTSSVSYTSNSDIIPLTTEPIVDAEVTLVNSQSTVNSSNSIWQFAFYVWLFIVILLIIQMIATNRKYAKKLLNLPAINDPSILDLLDKSKQLMSINRDIRLKWSDQVVSPTLYGILKPSLILPKEITQNLSLEQLHFIFLHELSHYKRKDIAINWLMQGLLILHWFNPILWYAFRRMREDQEIACDNLALTYLHPHESKAYGLTIITMLDHYTEHKTIPGIARLSGNKDKLKRRITMITLFNHNTNRRSIFGLIILIALSCILLTNSKTSATVSEPQHILEAFLDTRIDGNIDQAFSFVTATGISPSDLREDWEGRSRQDRLLAYKIIKFFNDDDTHASAYLSLLTEKQGQWTSAYRLIKQDDVWKIYLGDYAPPVSPPVTEILDGNDPSRRPSLAESYQIEQEFSQGNIGYAVPSSPPSSSIQTSAK